MDENRDIDPIEALTHVFGAPKQIDDDILGFFGPLIYTYTRAQAIEDGVLIDVTSAARQVGFTCPVAVTCGLWNEAVAVPEGLEGEGQSEAGRLHDVVSVLNLHVNACAPGTDTIHYELTVVGPGRRRRIVKLWAKAGPGDRGEMVLTIMLEGED